MIEDTSPHRTFYDTLPFFVFSRKLSVFKMVLPCKTSQCITQSVIVGLSCGVGFYLAREGLTKKRFSEAFSTLSHLLRSKSLWEATVPWWLVLACPSPWYPLALWFLMLTKSEEENGHSDPAVRPSSESVKAAVRTSTESVTFTQNIPEEKSKRYLEMLVHNVSHTDLVLSVDAPPETEESTYCLCRPRFSAFDMYCRRILDSVTGNENVINFPRYERSEASPRYSIVTPRPSRQGLLPTGLELGHSSSLEVPTEELPNLRFRGRDAHRIEPYRLNEEGRLQISHAFFPLLATLLPRWHSEMKEKFADKVHVKKVVVLVSGVGTPRNWTHSITGNSTQACAELMERFIHVLYPDVIVVRYVVLSSYTIVLHTITHNRLGFTPPRTFSVTTKTLSLSRENSCLA